jgi:hypothetical protein
MVWSDADWRRSTAARRKVMAHVSGVEGWRKDPIKPKQVQQHTQLRLKMWRGRDLPNMKITKRTQPKSIKHIFNECVMKIERLKNEPN